MIVIKDIADSMDDMIQFVFDYPGNHKSGKIPILNISKLPWTTKKKTKSSLNSTKSPQKTNLSFWVTRQSLQNKREQFLPKNVWEGWEIHR